MGRKDWARPGSEYVQSRREVVVQFAYLHPNGSAVTCGLSGGKISYPSDDAAERAARALETLGGAEMYTYHCLSTTAESHSHLATRRARLRSA